ncbi:MAG: poly-beta-1,6-N-acetyl-D-glucosamine biosynthesis protein PgaD [Burkholderiales bacterium]
MKRPLIIERPDLQTGRQRLLYGALTLLFWLLYIYLWLPLITLAGWSFGLWRGYDVLVTQTGFRDLLALLGWYASMIAAFAGTLIVWAVYNLVVFGGRERRAPPPPLAAGEQASYWGVPAGALEAWRRERVLVVRHDARGRIAVVAPPAPAAPPERAPQEAGRG